MAHDLAPPVLEMDEIWSYLRKKQARVTPAEHAAGLGEAYSFVSFAMPARYVVTWHVGKRDQDPRPTRTSRWTSARGLSSRPPS